MPSTLAILLFLISYLVSILGIYGVQVVRYNVITDYGNQYHTEYDTQYHNVGIVSYSIILYVYYIPYRNAFF